MKPLRLCFEAFGAFAGREVIDFEALAGVHGLFLVAGATGTGKSTIFDAMCWALYGDMPTKLGTEVCSDHVDDPARCTVTFEFAVGGGHYRVTRTPSYLRPKQRGTGFTEQKATALLEDLSGAHSEPLEHRWSVVTERVTELIGLNAEQFQRVILLPQGEFARFLRSNTNERKEVLSRLFGGQVYERIVDELKSRSRKLAKGVENHRVRMAGHLEATDRHLHRAEHTLWPPDRDDAVTDNGAPPGDGASERGALAQRLDAVDDELTGCATRAAEAQRSATRAHDELTRATAEAQRFEAAGKARARLAELSDSQVEVEAGRVAATRSAAARPVVDADHLVTEARAALARLEATLGEHQTTLQRTLAGLGAAFDAPEPHLIAATLTEIRSRNEADRRLVEAVAAATAALEAAQADEQGRADACTATDQQRAETEASLSALAEQRTSLVAAADGVAEATAQVERLEPALSARDALDALAPRLAAAQLAFDEASERSNVLLDRFVATQAPRLADQLETDEPCPVCGSCEHPAPATDDDGPAVNFPEVTAAAETREQHRATLTGLEAERDRVAHTLGDDADLNRDELVERLAAARTALAAAIDARNTCDRIDDDVTKLESDRRVLDERRAGQADAFAKATEATREAAAALDAARQAAGSHTAETVAAAATALGSAEAQLEAYRECHEAVGAAKSALATVTGQFDAVLAGSDFADVDAALAELLDRKAETAALERAAQHAADTARVSGALEQLQTQGIPAERPELATFQAAAAAADAALHDLNDRFTAASTLRDSAVGELERFDAGDEQFGPLLAQAELVARAEAVCARGGSARHIRLPLWVLARELDRITRAANVHLAQMTANRYTLARVSSGGAKNTVTDLDLGVTDSHTGKARSTASLSGGEQFQASLALALGLADVVSQGGTSNGATFEALFVDEGFGSLDRDSLDTAIETLLALRATGRMVGAITHVESMKEELHVGIQVRARGDQPGSTLTVHV